MKKLRYLISAITLVAIATVAGQGEILAMATPPSATSEKTTAPTQPFQALPHPEQVAQTNYRSDCRRITQNYTQFYTNFYGNGGGVGGVGILNNGDRIRLLDGGQTYQGPEGRLYYRVSSPYRSDNPTIGYISVNSSLAYCGRSARW